MNVTTQFSEKYQTPCCALFQILCNNETPIEHLQYQIERAKRDAKKVWNPTTRVSGERAAYVICVTHENILRENLIKLNFTKVFEFPRRNGYPDGICEMWTLSW